MDNVPLEKQIAVLKRQSRRLPKEDNRALLAAEQTLNRLLSLRQHLQNAGHDDEAAVDDMVEELLRLLGLPHADNVVKA